MEHTVKAIYRTHTRRKGKAFLSPDASSKGTIEMGVVCPCAWFPDDNL